MIGAVHIHQITGVRAETINHDIACGSDYYTRNLVIEHEMPDGSKSEITLTLFSQDGHNLLISDSDLNAIMRVPEKEAA